MRRSRSRSAAAMLALLGILAVSCGSDGSDGETAASSTTDETTGRRRDSDRAGRETTTSAPSAEADEADEADGAAADAADGAAADASSAPPADGTPLPLGTFVDDGPGDTCTDGFDDCLAFQVECPELDEAAHGEIDVRRATGPDRGVVVFFDASGGGGWWSEAVRSSETYVDELRDEGLTIVQVRWKRGSWLQSSPGEDAGTSRVACRPATAVRWAYDNVYVPLGLDPAPLQCGFCIAGNSGGASQVAYPLAFYGLDTIVDVAVASGGPPHSSLAKGCLRNPGEEEYWYSEPSVLTHIDGSFGFRNSTDGPCAVNDEGFVDRWRAESVDSGGNDYFHPETRIQFIFGEDDESGAPPHARDYVAALEAAGSPHVSVEVQPEMGHGLDQEGLALLRAALLG